MFPSLHLKVYFTFYIPKSMLYVLTTMLATTDDPQVYLFQVIGLEPLPQLRVANLDRRLCTQTWGHRLKRRLRRVEVWAEKQGLELAADCHLCRIVQVGGWM